MTETPESAPRFIIGAQKAGTTTIHEVLTAAGALTARDKETHFFSDDDRYARGIDWYDQQFAAPTGRIEIDPAYLVSPAAPRRIRKHYGDNVGYAVVLRDPFTRARSHHRMTVARGREHRDLVTALRAEIANARPIPYPEAGHTGYLGGSQYVRLLEHWQSVLPDADRLVVDFDDLIIDRNPTTWATLGTFLGLPNLEPGNVPVANAAFVPRSIGFNRFLFDRDSNRTLRRALHRIVPSERLRGRAAKFLYDRNRTEPSPASPPVDDAPDDERARLLVAQHVGFDRSDIENLLGTVDWPTFTDVAEADKPGRSPIADNHLEKSAYDADQ